MDEMITIQESIPRAAEILRREAHSENTHRAYTKAWNRFLHYCGEKEIEPQKASTNDVVDFLFN